MFRLTCYSLLAVPTAGSLKRTRPTKGVPPLSPAHCERSWVPCLPSRSLVQPGGHGRTWRPALGQLPVLERPHLETCCGHHPVLAGETSLLELRGPLAAQTRAAGAGLATLGKTRPIR